MSARHDPKRRTSDSKSSARGSGAGADRGSGGKQPDSAKRKSGAPTRSGSGDGAAPGARHGTGVTPGARHGKGKPSGGEPRRSQSGASRAQRDPSGGGRTAGSGSAKPGPGKKGAAKDNRESRDEPRGRKPAAQRGAARTEPLHGLFGELLQAPDRDHAPGAQPVLSLRGDEPPDFRDQLERRLLRRAHLARRGRDHGEVAELSGEGLVPPLPKSKELRAERAWRWHAARPVVLPGLLDAELRAGEKRLRAAGKLRERLAEPGGLLAWLRDKQSDLAPDFQLGEPELSLSDPERDLARVGLEPGELWAKVGRLSTFDSDASLRLRLSFGLEGDDDDSDDELRHAAVSQLGERLLPGAREVAGNAKLLDLLRRFTGHTPFLTQGIAYWNAPQGGALLHHDAFREEPGGQRGVVYSQLVGSTFWVALSTEDLGARLSEFAENLAEGEAPWLREELGLEAAAWQELLEIARDRARAEAELALPGSGRLAPLVQRGPEFTGFLVDAGHGFFLDPGDAVLLPNHGTRRTALHSVFHVGERVAYGLSLAVRGTADSADASADSAVG